MKRKSQDSEFKIEVSGDKDYLRISYFVPMTSELALKAGPELMRLAQEYKISRYLFDMRGSSNVQSVASNYFFAYEEIQTFDFPRDSVTAFIIDPTDNSHDFTITALKNAGYVVARFPSEEEALKWLLSPRD